MHTSVSLNFELLDGHDAFLYALGAASIYGKGIFTTVAIHESRPFLWEKHWLRLKENSERVGIDLSEFTEERSNTALAALIKTNGVTSGRARITFVDESATELWPFESTRRTSLLITTADFRASPGNLRLTTSPYAVNSQSPLTGVKSCNYLDKLLAREEAKGRGFDEAIQLNERGKITSASTANIFWLKDGGLFTPSLKTGCLAGTTREFVLEHLGCEEIQARIEEIRTADEIFVTSAGIGVAQVAEFDGRNLGLERHAIMDLLPPRT